MLAGFTLSPGLFGQSLPGVKTKGQLWQIEGEILKEVKQRMLGPGRLKIPGLPSFQQQPVLQISKLKCFPELPGHARLDTVTYYH